MGTDWHGAWTAALDALEADVAQVEALLADDHRMRDTPSSDPWHPPAGIGPLPLELRPRADAVLARQVAAAQSVALALATNRRQAVVASRIDDGTRGAARPSYVDCAM